MHAIHQVTAAFWPHVTTLVVALVIYRRIERWLDL